MTIDLGILVACNIANFILGLSILLRNPRKLVNRSFAFLSFSIILWTTLNFFADNAPQEYTLLFSRLTFAAGGFLGISVVFLSRYFPNEEALKKSLLNKWQVSFAVVAGLLSMSPWVVESAHPAAQGAELTTGTLYVVYLVYILQAVAVLVYNFLIQIKKSHSALQKSQVKLILAGILLYGVFAIGANLVLPLLIDNWTSSRFGPLFSLFLVGVTAYAIVRHRLFDIRLVAVRTLAYSLSIITLALIYSLIAFGLANSFLGAHDNLELQVFYLAIAILLALTFTPLKSFFDKVTRSIFYQDAYESQKVIDDLSSVLVSTVSISELSRNSLEILREAMKSQSVAILLTSRQNSVEHLVTTGKGIKYNEHELIELLETHKEKILVQDELRLERTKLNKVLRNANCAVVARLEAHDDSIGYILFSIKSNGRPYTRQDIDLIHIVADELALGIQNALRFEEIRQFNQTLQQRIDDATKELRKTNEQLQKLDAAKDEFVSMASHQLRTPLTSIKGYISMVLEGDVGKITPTQHQMLSEAFTSSERMVHLIGDFLNVSRLQTGKFMLEDKPVDLSKLVAQEIDSLQTTIEAHGLKLQYHKPSYFPVLMLDEGKIRQVLMNFIDNAIFYSPEGKTITVKLSVEEGFAVVRVIDAGIGVPKSEQAHLFTKFFRASNARKQRPDGTGVGLFLAKKVIAAHGGVMVFESEEGKGSTFGFRLPIKKLQASGKDTKTSAGNSAYQLKK